MKTEKGWTMRSTGDTKKRCNSNRSRVFDYADVLYAGNDGNRLSNITAITEALPFDGVTGLHADGEFELAYNDAGDMVSDASRGLLHTRWNADGHPVQYDLEGGHRQLLGWDAFGNHLYTSYETSVACVPGAHAAHPCTRTSAMATCFAAESDTPLGIKELAAAFYGGELRL